jgi:16S rRNA (guanine966-N2)-methyltransferase
MPSGQVRILGGRWKRTPLAVAAGAGLRPTASRVRETLFNWLGQDLSGWSCLDLFAGSGALGFEAASRGAARVVMIESNPAALAGLRRMRDKLAAAMIDLRAGDALALGAGLGQGYDLVFCDPPYERALHARALAMARRLLAPDGLLYTECARPLAELPDMAAELAHWQTRRQARAGQVYYYLLQSRRLEPPTAQLELTGEVR